MKIEVSFDKLKNVVGKAVNAVMKVGQNAALKGVYFEAGGENVNNLLIRSTNIDIGFETTILCKVEREGKFLISGEVLGRLLTTVNTRIEDVCILDFTNNVLNVKIGKHEFSLKTLSFESFPNLPKVEGVEIVLDKNVFLGGLRSVVYSVAKSEIKPEISGVYVKMGIGNANEIVFVATDAYRLAEKKYILETELPELSFILPEKNIKELLKIFGEDVGNEGKKITLTISKNSVQMQIDNLFVVTRLIEGNFPNYTQIIPTTPVSFSVYLKEDFIKSLRLVSFFTEKTNQILLNVTEVGSEIEASSQEVGNTKEFISSTLKGEVFSMKINAKYLEEFLQNLTDQSIVVKYTAQNKAIIVQGLQDANYTYLLMPSYR